MQAARELVVELVAPLLRQVPPRLENVDLSRGWVLPVHVIGRDERYPRPDPVTGRHLGGDFDAAVLDVDLSAGGEHARLDGRDDLVIIPLDVAVFLDRAGACVAELNGLAADGDKSARGNQPGAMGGW